MAHAGVHWHTFTRVVVRQVVAKIAALTHFSTISQTCRGLNRCAILARAGVAPFAHALLEVARVRISPKRRRCAWDAARNLLGYRGHPEHFCERVDGAMARFADLELPSIVDSAVAFTGRIVVIRTACSCMRCNKLNVCAHGQGQDASVRVWKEGRPVGVAQE